MLTLPALLRRSVRLFGDRTAIMDPQGRWTWREFSGRVGRAAAVLKSLGVSKGQRFGILCRNGYRNTELMQAGYWLGAVPVPINYRLAPPEIAYILNDADCRVVAVEDSFLELMRSAELKAWSDRL
ncbi:MAG: AMP-binding protein, partial [Deltaproteobacteria bacterium]|nr:AMP-binding protein [Deltaproteobacteria bacterium]